jgi:ABC-type branched-subunit amino acid transport system ATPase component
MAGKPRLLLLDEPTAGLGAEEVAAVAHAIQVVRDAGVTILVIAHHVGFVRQVADRCTVFDFGKVVASGTPAEVLEDRHVVEIFVGDGAKA